MIEKLILACVFLLAAGASVMFCVFAVTVVYPDLHADFQQGNFFQAVVEAEIMFVMFVFPLWLLVMAYIGFK